MFLDLYQFLLMDSEIFAVYGVARFRKCPAQDYPILIVAPNFHTVISFLFACKIPFLLAYLEDVESSCQGQVYL